MPLSRRYSPSSAWRGTLIGYDYSFLLPVGVGITSGSLAVMNATS